MVAIVLGLLFHSVSSFSQIRAFSCRYALPIKNKDIRTIQSSLEEIDEKLKVPGQKSLPPVVKISNTVQNMLSKRKSNILSE